MSTRNYLLASAALTLALPGCVDSQDGKAPANNNMENTGQTGIAIKDAVDAPPDTDVTGMKYAISRIACMVGEKFAPLSREVRVNLEKMLLPGGIPAFENSPLDKNSAHPFSDHFEVLPAGCYDVSATPLTAKGDASADCAVAWDNGVAVDDGLTTDIFMISQCKGTPTGALDSTIALNKPPQLTNVTFSPSKFSQAGQKVTICATAVDPENDPLEFDWSQLGGGACGTSVISDQKGQEGSTECVEVEPMAAGNYLFQVTVYDLVHGQDGKLIRIEQWLRDHGYPNTSHASLRFPLYVGAAAGASGK